MWVPGSNASPAGAPAAGTRHPTRLTGRGFTLIELLVVVAIIAIASAGVSFVLRDAAATQLERESQRLAALLESGRARARSTGVAVRWQATENGFRFEGLAPGSLPENWLAASTQVRGNGLLVLGPDPIIAPQSVLLVSADQPDRSLRISTDGLRPFTVSSGP